MNSLNEYFILSHEFFFKKRNKKTMYLQYEFATVFTLIPFDSLFIPCNLCEVIYICKVVVVVNFGSSFQNAV